MFICEIWLFVWCFPQFCTSDMSKYGYLEVFQGVPSSSRKRESTVLPDIIYACAVLKWHGITVELQGVGH